jgi:hypothetical protein
MSNQNLYVKLGNPKRTGDRSIIQALTIDKDIQPVVISV